MQFLASLLAAALGLMAWQQFRYFRIRREFAQDCQSLLHPSKTFHVIVFFTLRDGEKFLPVAGAFVADVMALIPVKFIHGGRAAFTQQSQQLGEHRWSGVVMFEFSSRREYEKSSRALGGTARNAFQDHHFHGMSRDRLLSMAVPQLLLHRRIGDMIRGEVRVPALKRMPAFKKSTEYDIWRRRVARLRALHQINPRGLVVYNLIRHGSAAQRRANESYTRKMLSRMAALSHGPLHVGRPVGIEGNARFDQVVVMHYPSANYFADLLSSEFFQGIIADKQVADTTSVPTIPMTELLRASQGSAQGLALRKAA